MPPATTAAPAVIPVSRPWLGAEEAQAAGAAITSEWVLQGPRVAEFEARLAARVGAAHGVATSSCTTALHLAMVALGLGRGDEVIVPSLSFIATANAARYVGATPVFADVDPATASLTAATVDAVRTPATRAVVVAHQGGMPAHLDELRDLCAARDLALVEDAACALGSTYREAPVGQGARLAAFSFHPRKVLTTGEGGMLTTDDAELAARLRRLRNHGMSVSAAERHAASAPVAERFLETGYNYRLTDIQAAVGLVQLGKLDAMVARRRQLAARYQRLLPEFEPGLEVSADPGHGTTNYQSFWLVLPDGAPAREEVLARLKAAGVSARPGIMAAHLEPAYAGHPHTGLPATERLARRSVILPLYHQLTEADQDRVVAAVRAALRP
jgi:dTDP-4-amino-4,6-dideoxygalactose transaminase